MNKYLPYEKLSKKKKRELNSKRRGSWGEISPITRKTPNPKAYKRKKARSWNPDDSQAVFFYLLNTAQDLPLPLSKK